MAFCFTAVARGNAQDKQAIALEEGAILAEQAKAVKSLIKVAPVIDNDDASYWCYETADSIINSIESDGGSFFIKESKVYAALSRIFAGMSYMRSVMHGNDAVERLHERRKFMIDPLPDSTPADSVMLLTAGIERIFISAFRNFYSVSDMKSTDMILEREAYFDGFTESITSTYSGDPSKYLLLINKKLFNQTFIVLLIELEMVVNNGKIGKGFADQVVPFATEQDGIETGNISKVCRLNDLDFIRLLHKGTRMQSRYIEMLAERIGKLR